MHGKFESHEGAVDPQSTDNITQPQCFHPEAFRYRDHDSSPAKNTAYLSKTKAGEVGHLIGEAYLSEFDRRDVLRSRCLYGNANYLQEYLETVARPHIEGIAKRKLHNGILDHEKRNDVVQLSLAMFHQRFREIKEAIEKTGTAGSQAEDLANQRQIFWDYKVISVNEAITELTKEKRISRSKSVSSSRTVPLEDYENALPAESALVSFEREVTQITLQLALLIFFEGVIPFGLDLEQIGDIESLLKKFHLSHGEFDDLIKKYSGSPGEVKVMVDLINGEKRSGQQVQRSRKKVRGVLRILGEIE